MLSFSVILFRMKKSLIETSNLPFRYTQSPSLPTSKCTKIFLYKSTSSSHLAARWRPFIYESNHLSSLYTQIQYILLLGIIHSISILGIYTLSSHYIFPLLLFSMKRKNRPNNVTYARTCNRIELKDSRVHPPPHSTTAAIPTEYIILLLYVHDVVGSVRHIFRVSAYTPFYHFLFFFFSSVSKLHRKHWLKSIKVY